ncbi:TonB family C-terminal domain-containing protein [Syntrophus gentianae]|uniref:TonB family C-terminal domain-containing protein n=1 Tax=Syntrophus gentianae TaxID=43775 RepID=A0A1H7YM29_9BACT|nr:cell envelope integrity protein TolA [Syntrophus gentianae]SEM47035.1 TonB family C-terminal domain-containing protein [Syntrophus gentianae]
MTFNSAFEESWEDRRFLRRMIVISLLLHIFALSLSSLFSTLSSPKKILNPNYTVDLVSSGDLRTKGDSGKGGSGAPEKKPVEIPAALAKAGPGKADFPLPTSGNKAEAKKNPEKPLEKVAQKIVKREPPVPPMSSKPVPKAEKTKNMEASRGDAIEKILKRADAVPKAAKPVKNKGSETAKGDAIEEILKGTDKPARSADSGQGTEASLGKAMDEIRKRVDYAERRQRGASASPGTGSGFSSASGSGVSGISEGSGPSGTVGNAELNARMYAYYRLIWARIKKQWTLSPGLLPKGDIGAVIHVRVLRNGTVEGLSFEKRSGNNYFDESALRAVRKASPFPPLPQGMGDENIEIGIRFHSAELR